MQASKYSPVLYLSQGSYVGVCHSLMNLPAAPPALPLQAMIHHKLHLSTSATLVLLHVRCGPRLHCHIYLYPQPGQQSACSLSQCWGGQPLDYCHSCPCL
jgi:hypothetical protein